MAKSVPWGDNADEIIYFSVSKIIHRDVQKVDASSKNVKNKIPHYKYFYFK
jgi:hypothetical protein